ncbi:MAG: MBL fold metallo-hydrolase [Alphaproteobacteria bacterium]|nr:MBL fold metallo-hydrolase [Alphaproteobacteria bacterium]
MSLSVLPLGVGDAFSARYWSTSLLVECVEAGERFRLLVDCPHPIRRVLAASTPAGEPPLDIGDLDAVLITHTHADHCSGLEGLGFFAYFALQRRLPLLAHPAVLERLWHKHLAAGMDQLVGPDGALHRMRLEDYFVPQPLSLSQAARVGPLELRCRMTRHHVPTTALLLRGGGRELGYSADTAYDPELIAWLGEADLIVHETNLGTHTPYDALAALPEGWRRRARLIHYTDDFDLDASVIPPLREGQRVEV